MTDEQEWAETKASQTDQQPFTQREVDLANEQADLLNGGLNEKEDGEAAEWRALAAKIAARL